MNDTPGDLADCNSDRVLPGDGVLDLTGMIAALEQGGYSGLFSVELFNDALWRLPAAEAAQRCYTKSLALCASEINFPEVTAATSLGEDEPW